VKGAYRTGSERGAPVSIHQGAPLGFFIFFGFSARPVGSLPLAAILSEDG
jgi:hypothetical protein